MKRFGIKCIALATVAMLFSGCGALKGGLIGGAAAGALGAGIGALAGGGKGAAIGAGVGVAVGATAGALIGKKMEKQKAELEAIEGADVETVTDVNGLDALKVTFDSGILFATNKSDLTATSKASLDKFAISLLQNPETDVTIYGHTDSTGSLEVNQRISLQRAQSVQSYLQTKGVEAARIVKVEGKAYSEPVASNDTAEGRAANRRVEVYISANEAMVEQAEAGTLK